MWIKYPVRHLLFFLCSLVSVCANDKVTHLYHSLDSSSMMQLLAFYRLYPESSEGKQALDKCWSLINKHRSVPLYPLQALILPELDVEPMIALVTKQPHQTLEPLSQEALATIELLSDHLHHRKLKGHLIETIEDILPLKDEELDLARAIFLYEFSGDMQQVRLSESQLDVMALQILGHLKPKPTDREKIDAITQFVFHEMQYRFPPQSMWAKEKEGDQYTYLPSVLDSRHGVCLGVSILYLCLAQRLDVPLQIITPPGHIFLRFEEDSLNIETTARGIHIEDDKYLNIYTKALQFRNIKEVIGLYFMNAAAAAWHTGEHHKAIACYKKSSPYLPNDSLLKRFLGYNYLFIGEKKKGEDLLRFAHSHPLKDYLVQEETTITDYLGGHVDPAGIKLIFQESESTRTSLLNKQKSLDLYLKQYPYFREGLFQLAVTHLQLGSISKALDPLEQYHKLDPTNPLVEYYLALIHMKRLSFTEAKKHVTLCQKILKERDHNPKELQALEEEWRAKAGFL